MTAASIVAPHVGYIRDGATGLPPGVVPQIPAPEPARSPLSLRVQAVPTLGATVGAALSSTTVATLQGDEPAPVLFVERGIPGLTFSLSWAGGAGTVSVAGTPTGPAGAYRASLYYLSGDGEIRGASMHEFVLVDAAATFQVLTQLNGAGRVGQPISGLVLATLRHSAPIQVDAVLTTVPAPGLATSLSWVPGSPSSGTLSISGTPLLPGTYDIGVTYRWRDISLGSTQHQVVIGAAAAPPVPAPAPAPAPAPMPPAPAPAPAAPAPVPVPMGDALLASVLLLERFEVVTRDVLIPAGTVINEGGEVLSEPVLGPAYVKPVPFGILSAGTIVNGKDISPAPPASGEGGGRFGNTTWYVKAPAGSTALDAPELTAECFVKPVSPELWQNRRFAEGYLFAMMSGRAAGRGDACCWSIGFISAQLVDGVAAPRRLVPYIHVEFEDGETISLAGSAVAKGVGYLHLAGQVQQSGATSVVSLWCGGRRVASATKAAAAGLRVAESVWLGRVGVTDNDSMLGRFAGLGRLTRDAPYGSFDVDDARLTAAARYTVARGVAGDTIPADMLTIPWPTY